MSNYIGRLEQALTAAGLKPNRIIPGVWQRCPVEGDRRGKTSGAYRLFDDANPVCIWWNWKAGTSGSWHAKGAARQTPEEHARMIQLMQQAQRERELEQAQEWENNAERNARMWDGAQPLTPACPPVLYLARRLLVPGVMPAVSEHAIRYAPAIEYWDGLRYMGTCPAMLALVTAPDGTPVSIHRTYLTSDGQKAPVPTVKKLTGTSGPMCGASIKLQPPAIHGARLSLGVAEGIETAMAASLLSGGLPVWSCVSANGLTTFAPPQGLQSLYVFADNDASGTGQKAAAELAQRTARAGLATRVLTPPGAGTDWADQIPNPDQRSRVNG